jgi:hypothetical protein
LIYFSWKKTRRCLSVRKTIPCIVCVEMIDRNRISRRLISFIMRQLIDQHISQSKWKQKKNEQSHLTSLCIIIFFKNYFHSLFFYSIVRTRTCLYFSLPFFCLSYVQVIMHIQDATHSRSLFPSAAIEENRNHSFINMLHRFKCVYTLYVYVCGGVRNTPASLLYAQYEILKGNLCKHNSSLKVQLVIID